MWFDSSGSKYGTRLNGIEKVELGDKYLKETEGKLNQFERGKKRKTRKIMR